MEGSQNANLVAHLLRLLGSIDDSFAVLHNADMVSTYSSGDVDIAVTMSPKGLLKSMRDADSEILLVAAWRYGPGAYASIWSRPGGLGVAKLDLTSDPLGLGKLRFRTRAALSQFREDHIWPPRLKASAEAIYVGLKSIDKGDSKRFLDALEKLPPKKEQLEPLLMLIATRRFRRFFRHLPKSIRGFTKVGFCYKVIISLGNYILRIGTPAGLVLNSASFEREAVASLNAVYRHSGFRVRHIPRGSLLALLAPLLALSPTVVFVDIPKLAITGWPRNSLVRIEDLRRS